MPRTRTTLTAAVLAVALAVPTAVVGTATVASADRKPKASRTAVGLVDGVRLVRFPLANPRKARQVARVSGFTGGDTELVGIDYRIQDKRLYGVGDQGGVYRVGDRGGLTLVNRLTVALSGSEFGVDFNPAADRLRIIGDDGQNLRHDVNPGGAGTIADTPLSYPGPTGATPGTGLTGAAYTNNDLDDRTGTVLYDIDTRQDQLAVQSPANAGTLAAVGKLRRATGADVGFDIDRRNHGWAVLETSAGQRLFRVDLLDGRTALRGGFPRNLQVSDLAIPLR